MSIIPSEKKVLSINVETRIGSSQLAGNITLWWSTTVINDQLQSYHHLIPAYRSYDTLLSDETIHSFITQSVYFIQWYFNTYSLGNHVNIDYSHITLEFIITWNIFHDYSIHSTNTPIIIQLSTIRNPMTVTNSYSSVIRQFITAYSTLSLNDNLSIHNGYLSVPSYKFPQD